MLIVVFSALTLLALTTLVHYEVMGRMHARLQALHIPSRSKLLVVVFVAFAAHALEIVLYGVAFYGLARFADVGTLAGPAGVSLASCFYFSAETFTSLGFGDLTPTGAVRFLAGVEALNGLVLIGWSASFLYIAMERFWNNGPTRRP